MAFTVDEVNQYYADRPGLVSRESRRRAANLSALGKTSEFFGGKDWAPGGMGLLLGLVLLIDWLVGDWAYVLKRLPVPQQVVGWVFPGLDKRDPAKTLVEQAQEAARKAAKAKADARAKEMKASQDKAVIDTLNRVAEVEAKRQLAAADRELFLARFADWRAGLVKAAGPLQYDWRDEVGPIVAAAAANMAQLGPAWRDAELPQACGVGCIAAAVDGLRANAADDGAWQGIAAVLAAMARDRDRSSFLAEGDRLAERLIGVLRGAEPPWVSAKSSLLAAVEGCRLADRLLARKREEARDQSKKLVECRRSLEAWERQVERALESVAGFLPKAAGAGETTVREASRTTMVAKAARTGVDDAPEAMAARLLVLGWRKLASEAAAEAVASELIERARAGGDWRSLLAVLTQDLRDEQAGRYRVAGMEIAGRGEVDASLARVKTVLRQVVAAKHRTSPALAASFEAALADLRSALRGLSRSEGRPYSVMSQMYPSASDMIAKVDAGKMSVTTYFREVEAELAKGHYEAVVMYFDRLRDWAQNRAEWRKNHIEMKRRSEGLPTASEDEDEVPPSPAPAQRRKTEWAGPYLWTNGSNQFGFGIRWPK